MKRFRALFLTVALGGSGLLGVARSVHAQPAPNTEAKDHQIFGTIRSIKGARFELETRDKRTVTCDAAEAIKDHRTVILAVGQPVAVSGQYDQKGVLKAETIQRAKASAAVWPVDR